MNIERIDHAIELMKSAKSLYMPMWQSTPRDTMPDIPAKTVEELHSCGNSACLAGYLALTQEWKEAGGDQTDAGGPVLNTPHGTYYQATAIAEWFDIPFLLADGLVNGGSMNELKSEFYGKMWKDVTAEDVIEKLQAIKRNESE